MRRIILLMGAPGSGKSTQGQLLAKEMGYKWVSTGELLRESKEEWVKEQLRTAELFPDEMVFKLLNEALSGAEGAILDGAIRTRAQAEMALAADFGIDAVVELVVPQEELTARVLDRGREQDTLEVVSRRLDDYYKMRAEILEVLTGAGVKILEVDGVGTPEEVHERLVNSLKEER